MLTTTNCAPALFAAAECANEILVGCVVNLAAVLQAIDARDDVVLVCAGHSVLDVVPRLAGLTHGIAIVDAGGQAARSASAGSPSGLTWVTGSP